jgi:hypothetical protein
LVTPWSCMCAVMHAHTMACCWACTKAVWAACVLAGWYLIQWMDQLGWSWSYPLIFTFLANLPSGNATWHNPCLVFVCVQGTMWGSKWCMLSSFSVDYPPIWMIDFLLLNFRVMVLERVKFRFYWSSLRVIKNTFWWFKGVMFKKKIFLWLIVKKIRNSLIILF